MKYKLNGRNCAIIQWDTKIELYCEENDEDMNSNEVTPLTTPSKNAKK